MRRRRQTRITGRESSAGAVKKIALVCDGDPANPHTNSGVAYNFIAALKGREDVEVVAAIDTVPPRLVRMLLQGLAFHPNTTRWRQRSRRGLITLLTRSLLRDIGLRRAGLHPDTIVVHIRNFYRPTRHRYVSFIDTTALDNSQHWSTRGDLNLHFPRPSALKLERSFYHGAALIATASLAGQRSLESDYRIPSSRIAVVGGGTNTLGTDDAGQQNDDKRSVEHAGRVIHQGEDEVRILFVGRDFARKGGDLLVDAASSLRSRGVKVRVVVAGCEVLNPPEFVESRGFITSRDVMAALYADADIFCLPARWEPYGLVVQEAMSMGLPVIVSNVGELPRIVVDGRSGLIVNTEDKCSLAGALEALVSDRQLREQLGREGRRIAVTEMTWEAVVERMLLALNESSTE